MMTDVKERDDCLRETNRELVLIGLRGGGVIPWNFYAPLNMKSYIQVDCSPHLPFKSGFYNSVPFYFTDSGAVIEVHAVF